MKSYSERHVSFGVDVFQGLWKLQFLHPFFYADTKRVVTVYVVPPNSDYKDQKYNGYEVVKAGPHLIEVMTQLIPMIRNYPYRWELEGTKLDSFGYDLISEMSSNSEAVNEIDFTDIAFAEIKRYYDFTEAIALPEVVSEDEIVQRDGAMVKLEIDLEKAQWTNQVSFDFFTAYPIEIVSVMYQEDTLKYSAVYEIPLKTVQYSASSLSILFPSVFAKKFIIILAQSTYTVSNTASLGIVSTVDKNNVETLSINLSNYLDVSYDEIWGKQEVAYQSARINNSASNKATVKKDTVEWRPQYQAARNKADEDMKTYEQKLKEYQAAESQYKKEMEEYVKYQQDLAAWQSKWG